MNISHHMRLENSGLMQTTLEIVEEEQRQGHGVRMQEPTPKANGALLETFEGLPDIHCIHSQLAMSTYHDGRPKLMIMHGEPLGSVGNGISMRAIVDLAPSCDAFICMREEEWAFWNVIRRTHIVTKGIDLDRFKILDPSPPKLSGKPAILYYENWRGQRNPLILCLAMLEIIKVMPEAKLHLYNCPGGKMFETFQHLIDHCRWYTFIGSLKGPEKDVVTLLNRADIIVSCLYPLYARGIEALGCGKAFLGPGYKISGYPYNCDLEPDSMAKAMMRIWEEYGSFDFRQWAEGRHNIKDTVKQCTEIFARYVR